MNLAERLVESAAEEFRKPEKQRAEDGERGRDTHDEMEMSGDEFVADSRGGEIASREEDSRNSARHEERNETDGEQHRGVELKARVPERAQPTDQQNHGGQTERGSQQRKDQRRKRIHAAGKHVLAPNAKTKNADGAQRQNNESFVPDGLSRKRGNQMRGQTEAREHGYVDFCLRKKP